MSMESWGPLDRNGLHEGRHSGVPRSYRATIAPAALVILWMGSLAGAHAQTVEDQFMLKRREFLTGLSYSHDRWEEYWEGGLKRVNGNIGTITTQTATWTANYGLTDRVNVITSVPYVWTRASLGVLHGMEGFQDLTMAAKLRLFQKSFGSSGSLLALGAISGSIPVHDYSPDFLPLSIGTAGKRVSGRLTLNYRAEPGWFLNGSAAYTWRDTVRLDRDSYFTNGRLFMTNEVAMPNVFDYTIGTGYSRQPLMGTLFYSEQRTRGGGDIRRQDTPFVSNRVDSSKMGVMLSYAIPRLTGLEWQLSYAYTTDGRNVGQATVVTTGLTYRFGVNREDAR
jgi:hypothetical protein